MKKLIAMITAIIICGAAAGCAMSCMKLRRIPRRGRTSYLDRVNNIQTSESLQSKISLMGIQ